MADRIEREIEEILARLDQEEPLPGGDKKPVSIMAAKAKRKQTSSPAPRPPRRNPLANVNLTSFLILGAGMVLGGLILANFWNPLIWISFGGVVVFLGAFAASFFRSRPAGGAPAGSPKGVYWRDRYISYEPADQGAWQRIKRRFRR